MIVSMPLNRRFRHGQILSRNVPIRCTSSNGRINHGAVWTRAYCTNARHALTYLYEHVHNVNIAHMAAHRKNRAKAETHDEGQLEQMFRGMRQRRTPALDEETGAWDRRLLHKISYMLVSASRIYA